MRYVLKYRTSNESTGGELAHWGIKGMRWGRRRFQNEDGSLTDAGRKRYSDGDADDKSKSDGSDKGREFIDINTLNRNTYEARVKKIIDDYKAEEDEIGRETERIVAERDRKSNEAKERFEREGRYGPDRVLRDPDALDTFREITSDANARLQEMKEAHRRNEEKMRAAMDALENKKYAVDPDDVSKNIDSDDTGDNSNPAKQSNVDKPKGKTNTEKEAEEAHERAEERARKAEKNRKEEEAEQRKNELELAKSRRENEREEEEAHRRGERRREEAERNRKEEEQDLMKQATEDRKKRVEREISDLNNVAAVTGAGAKLASASAKAVKSIPIKTPRMDLSKLSNKEMQERIQREMLERQYDQMFNTNRQQAERGRDTVASILETVGTVASVGTAAIGLATAIKKLRGS